MKKLIAKWRIGKLNIGLFNHWLVGCYYAAGTWHVYDIGFIRLMWRIGGRHV